VVKDGLGYKTDCGKGETNAVRHVKNHDLYYIIEKIRYNDRIISNRHAAPAAFATEKHTSYLCSQLLGVYCL